jgi:hypothetical protein
MRFYVSTADGEVRTYNGTPNIEEGGVLRIDQDGPKPGPKPATIWLSPAFWQEITEDAMYDPVKGDYYPFQSHEQQPNMG